MVPLKTYAVLGLVCGCIILVFSVYFCVENVTRIVDGDNLGFIGLPMNLAWVFMTFVFIVSIKKKNLKVAKIYKTFFVTNYIITFIFEVVIIHIMATNEVHVFGLAINVWIFSAIMFGFALVLLAVAVWIFTKVNQYIESENEVGETTQVFKQIQ